MPSAAVPSPRTIRRLDRRVHDPIANWLGAVLRSLVKRVWPRFADTYCIPERQDLYGFTANRTTEPFEH